MYPCHIKGEEGTEEKGRKGRKERKEPRIFIFIYIHIIYISVGINIGETRHMRGHAPVGIRADSYSNSFIELAHKTKGMQGMIT